MTTAPVAGPNPSPAMKRDTLYHGADIAKLFDDVVEQAWLDRRTQTPKHRIIDALLLLAVEHKGQLPAYLRKLDQRRSAGQEATSDLG